MKKSPSNRYPLNGGLCECVKVWGWALIRITHILSLALVVGVAVKADCVAYVPWAVTSVLTASLPGTSPPSLSSLLAARRNSESTSGIYEGVWKVTMCIWILYLSQCFLDNRDNPCNVFNCYTIFSQYPESSTMDTVWRTYEVCDGVSVCAMYEVCEGVKVWVCGQCMRCECEGMGNAWRCVKVWVCTRLLEKLDEREDLE